MGAGHDHAGGGHSSSRAEDRRRLWRVVAITSTVLVVEVVGGLLSGSLALLADAGHMLTDVLAVLLALAASYLATRPANDRRTFGYHRAEVLAALVNAVVLVGVSAWLLYAGIRRLLDPPDLDAGQMLLFAVIGLLANGISLTLLTARRDRSQAMSLNLRGVLLEVLGDAVGSASAVVAALVILATGWLYADPIGSLFIALLIVPRALSLVRDTGSVLFESTPDGVEVARMREHLVGMDGVVEVHDVHAWTITSGLPSLSAHVTVTDSCLEERGVGAVLDQLARCAREDFGIEHATFQVEPESHRSHEDLGQDEHA